MSHEGDEGMKRRGDEGMKKLKIKGYCFLF